MGCETANDNYTSINGQANKVILPHKKMESLITGLECLQDWNVFIFQLIISKPGDNNYSQFH